MTHPTPNPAPATGAAALGPGPLGPEHLRELQAARVRMRKVRRAAAVAAMSGWSLAAFAGITVLTALGGDLLALLLGAGMGIIAFNELRGARMLRALEPRGPRLLGFNQITLGAMLIVYAGASLMSAMHSKALAEVKEQLAGADLGVDVVALQQNLVFAFYGALAALGVIVPGFTALYYFSRARLVRDVLAKTPPWAVEAIRAAGA